MGVAGPPLVKASTGQDLTPEQIGAAAIHEGAGGVERMAEDDDDALAQARRYMSFPVLPRLPFADARPGGPDAVRGWAFREGPRPVRELVDALVDADSAFELRPTWHPEVVTAFARLEGRAVGVVATDGAVDEGRLTGPGCDKIARFVRLCDSYGLPLLVLLDSAGAADDRGPGDLAAFRHAARVPVALAEADIPVVTVVVGRVGGVAQALLGGFGRFLEGPPHLMWPTARIEGLGVPAGSAAGDPLRAAASFLTDDVIDPGRTREVVSRLIDAAPPRAARAWPAPIDPW
jgi:acetyl-CoA carboxylase carboxyltransferase component